MIAVSNKICTYAECINIVVVGSYHLAISGLWFGQEREGILLELLCSSSIV